MPFITANGVRLFYDITGTDDAPPLLFSNSLGTSLEMWDEVIRGMAPYYRCIRYDTRGHGRSEAVASSASIHDLAADAAGLLGALGIESAHIAGLSIGGMTAQALAVSYPSKVRTLSLLATSAYMPPASLWEERIRAVRAEGTAPLAAATMERWFTPGFRERSPEKVERVKARLLTIPAEGYAVCCGAIAQMDLREPIRGIKNPTLIIAGADDPATTPAMAEDIKARIPHAELTILSPAAHLLAVERPEAVISHLLDFLSRHGGVPVSQAGASAFAAGLANRKAVLGVEHVERSLVAAGVFGAPWQDFITRNAWGEIWGDATLPAKTRSLVTLAMMVTLGREDEFKLHIRPALRNGVSLDELRALLVQTAIYAGMPAANNAFKWVHETLGSELG
jgi:3-oxoadipate enol-lactonase / 4-carboxymuconolactone decarboxylase